LLPCPQGERTQHDARKAERHYGAVDPENRLVARMLEQQWLALVRARIGRILTHAPHKQKKEPAWPNA